MTTKEKNFKLSELYLSDLERSGKSINTLKNYRVDIKTYIEYLGELSLEQATSDTAFKYRDYLSQEKKMKPTSVNRKVASAKSLYLFLKNKNIVSENIFDNVNHLKIDEGQKEQKNILTKDQLNILISTIENSGQFSREHNERFVIARDLFLVEFMARLSVGVEETIGLKRKQINFENNTITFKNRKVVMTDRVKKLCNDYIIEYDKKFGIMFENDYVFVSVNKSKLYNSNILDRLNKYCELSGLPRISSLSLKQTFTNITITNVQPTVMVNKMFNYDLAGIAGKFKANN